MMGGNALVDIETPLIAKVLEIAAGDSQTGRSADVPKLRIKVRGGPTS
jgi:hypothetical protein